DLCRATRDTVVEGTESSFGGTPTEVRLSAFWKGVALAPHRTLVVGRLDGIIAGALQLVRPNPLTEAGPYVAEIMTFFVAPWARGHGLARMMVETAEAVARGKGIRILDVSMRANRRRAIALFESLGYARWGEKEHYAFIGGKFVAGLYFSKSLDVPLP
ncbi:MAG: GNAT family N-acetyltransferase, partial [Alphaproteobacteria bacterium]